MKLMIIVFVAAFSTSAAAEQSMTGSVLSRECAYAIGTYPITNEREAIWAGHCLGLISGVMGYGMIAERLGTDKEMSFLFCQPDRVTPTQAAHIVVKHLNRYPETWHVPAIAIIIRALREAFPCDKR